MKTNKNIIYIAIIAIILIIIVIFALFNKKTKPVDNSPTGNNVSTKTIEFSETEKPYISLTPRTDGHMLKLKIEDIPSSVTSIEYELIYTAVDKTTKLEMEKGVGDTVKNVTKTVEKDLLLGTESCTNGCKYAYDEGITGGTLTLTFNTNDGQVIFNSSFSLTSSVDIKTKGLNLSTENLAISATTTTKSDFFVLIKNLKSVYSVFSNGTGAGKINSITPNTVTKENTNSLVGDYLIQ